jgi:predicted branched-subunit amino acid permease
MTDSTQPRPSAPYWSLSGVLEGARLCAPLLPGTIVFATAFGTIAAQKGLTLTETVVMNLLVFAGAAQLVAIEIWSPPLTFGTVASLAIVTMIVNARFLLMTASLRPWLGPLPAWQVYPALLLTTDATWIVGVRYHANGGNDASIYVGAGLALWFLWVVTVIPGYFAGAIVSDPKRFGFDLMLPIFFMAMLVQLWRGPRRAIGWAVSGAVALAAAQVIPGWWFIVVGALAGSIVGGFIDEPE